MKSQIEQLRSIVGQHGLATRPAGYPLRIDLLKQILAVPTCSGQEDQMVGFLSSHVRDGSKGLRGICVTDEWNNIFIRKGDAKYSPCVAAHIDTVHPPRPVQIIQRDGILFGLDQQGQRYVIEFDCPGRGLVSYTSGGTRLFANEGDFIRAAGPVLRAHGLNQVAKPLGHVVGNDV
jgi:hypothetical protein